MSSDVFKVKKSREGGGGKNREQIGTLDSLHERHIEDLHTRTSSEAIASLDEKISQIKLDLSGGFDPFEFADVMRTTRLQKELETLEDERSRAAEKYDIQKYYLDSGDIMLDYYAPPQKKTVSKIDIINK